MNNQETILENNILAIITAFEINDSNDIPTEKQVQILNNFKGWGAAKVLLYPIETNWEEIPNIKKEELKLEDKVRELHQIIEKIYPKRKDEIIKAIRNGILTSFYTPQEIPELIFQKIEEKNSSIERFLDPCAGGGVYIDKCLKYFPRVKVTAVEKDFLTAQILTAKYKSKPNVKIINQAFEEVNLENIKFDVIASNIPFGYIKVYDKNVPSEFTDKIHNYFFFKCQEALSEGGYMSIITSTGVFDALSNKPVRELLAKKGSLRELYVLPENLFKESNMAVASHLINYIKKDYLTNEDKLNNNFFIESITNEDGVKINKWIDSYKMIAFAEPPKLEKNQYGKLKYSYRTDIPTLTRHLRGNFSVPKLNIVPMEAEFEKTLTFQSFPETKLAELPLETNLQIDYLKNKTVPENFDIYEVVGAIKGNYKGKIVPIVTFTKLTKVGRREVFYYLETFVNEPYILEDPINDTIINAYNFNKKATPFFKKIYEFALEYQIKLHLDFRRSKSGMNLFNYYNENYQNPIFDIHYTKEEELPLIYHKEIEKNDITINENGRIAVISDIYFNNEVGENIYKSVEIALSLEQNRMLASLMRVYSRANIVINAISKGKTDIYNEIYFLNKNYDEFIYQYDYINQLSLSKAEKGLLEQYLPLLKSLEVKDSNQIDLFNKAYKKADIFSWKPINRTVDVLTPKEALIKSFVQSKDIDMQYMLSITQIETEEELYEQLKDFILFNPLINDYQLREEFLQGNLYKKLEAIKNLTEDNTHKVELIRFIEDSLPDWIEFQKIGINTGSRWLDKEYLNRFSKHYFKIDDIKIHYQENLDNLSVSIRKDQPNYNGIQLNNGRYLYPEQIISNAFYDIYPKVTSEGKIDFQSTQFLKNQITSFKRGFQQYLKDLPQEEKIKIEDIYNKKFNNTALVNFKGNLLDISDAQLKNLNINKVYEHQLAAAWKTMINRGGVVDHSVGFGKTLTMLLSSYYMKKINLVKKPILLALPANVGDIAFAYKKLFPEAKLLFATQKDYVKKNREVFLNKIITNDWDLVVMSHSQFQAIPPDPTIELQILEEEIKDLEENINIVQKEGFDIKILKNLQRKKENLTIKIKNKRLQQNQSKNVLSFEKLGIDHIIIDESHNYKNLGFQTQHGQVSGIGNTEGSKKCDYLLSAIRSIQMKSGKDFGASFYSGTPISNSLTELYTLFKYLIPNELEERGIKNFDSWASVFAEKTAEFEVNIVNQIQSKERFRYYNNLPELARIYSNISHVMHGDNKNIDRPNINEQFILNEQSPLQQRFNQKLIKFLKTGNQNILGLDTPLKIDEDQNSALSLLATNLAFKASVDMRLINYKYPDEEKSKINTLISKIMDYYKRFEEQKGTMIIFSEIGVSKKRLSFEEMEKNYQDQIFTSVYDDIKYKLMKKGVKEEEIAFIQHYKTDKKKEELSKKMNDGEIRILLGNTNNAGTGLNIQKRLCYINHLTIPWNPAYINQRNGRGHRTGNWICKEFNDNKIDIGYSVTKKTLDEYRVDLNKTKEGFIDQIRSVTNQRKADEGELDEQLGMNLAQLQAVLSGDNTLLEKTKIEKKLNELEEEKEFIYKQNRNKKQKIEKLEQRVEEIQTILEYLREDKTKYEENVIYDKKKVRINNPKYIGLKENATEQETIEFLKEKWREVKKRESGDILKIGELYGFSLYAKNSFLEGTKAYIQNDNNQKIAYTFKTGELDLDHPKEALKYYMNCFNSIGRRLESNQNLLEKEREELNKLKQLEPLTFTKEKEMLKLNDELTQLLIKLEETKGQRSLTLETIFSREVNNEIHQIKNIETLQRTLLEDFFITKKVQAVYANNEVANAFKILENESKNIDVLVNKYDSEKEHSFIKFEILNADYLYMDFMKLKDKNQFDITQDLKKRIKMEI